jgi:hypothetical protein
MLFITPPKINGSEDWSPSPSPLLDVMHSLNTLLDDDAHKKILDRELIKLLEGTPVQKPQQPGIKKFTAKKCSRNISEMFSQNMTLSNDKPSEPTINRGSSITLVHNQSRDFKPADKLSIRRRYTNQNVRQANKENDPKNLGKFILKLCIEFRLPCYGCILELSSIPEYSDV